MMDTLAREQQECYQKMEKLKTNYKKDSKARKTSQYCETRLNQLESYWAEFVQRDIEIQKFKEKNPHHAYFSQEYYNKVEVFYEDLKNTIQQMLEEVLQAQEKVKEAKALAAQKVTEAKAASRAVAEVAANLGIASDENTAEVPDIEGGTFGNRLILVQQETIRLLRRLIESVERELTQPHSHFYYQHKLSAMQSYWNKVTVNHTDIVANAIEESSNYLEDNTYQAIEDKYHEIVVRLQELIGTSQRSEDEVKLPRLILPVFEGDYQAWSSFHDIFVRLIHNNARLGGAEKMQYLKTHVRKEASSLLQHLTISDANYETAWKLLVERFNNKRKICSTQLQILLSQPKLETESALGIRKLHDVTRECLHSLSNLGLETDNWAPLITHIIIQKLDPESHKLFEQHLEKPREIPTYEVLFQFLETRFQSLELIKDTKKKDVNTTLRNNKTFEGTRYKTYHTVITKPVKCSYCQQAHKIYKCSKFLALPVSERKHFIQSNRLCHNCLIHKDSEKCLSQFLCSVCKKRHHTLLHQAKQTLSSIDTRAVTQDAENSCVQSFQSKLKNNVLLATALVKARAANGQTELLRALIDPGSQATFISEASAQLLALPRMRADAEVSGIGLVNSGIVRHKLHLELTPRFPSTYSIRLEALILPKLTQNLPDKNIANYTTYNWDNMMLADPTFDTPGPIDMIIGADIYGKIIREGIKKFNNGILSQLTEFGWIISGPIDHTVQSSNQITSMVSRVDIDKTLKRFWEMEEADTSTPVLSKQDEECEKHFVETHKRNSDGSYTVRIPFKENIDQLGESRRMAVARLLQNEKKFLMNKKLGAEYKAFMQEYITLKHMVPVNTTSERGYYLPHQAVIKENSTTTKLRVVFNGSARTTSGLSLNDTMYTGQKLQNDLTDILLRWRKHRYVLSADIEKMYRQIKIDPKDQNYLRILWRASSQEPIKEYQLTTVTYGTASAPFLALRTLHQLAEDEKTTHPISAHILLKDFYVDDVLTGADSLREAKILQRDLSQLLAAGGFNLRKWASNQQSILQNICEDLRDRNKLEITDNETIKTLGLNWLPAGDYFQFQVNLSKSTSAITKRTVLSDIARLFDPIGWLSPVVIRAKIILQSIWMSKLGWDDPLPDDICKKWIQFRDELSAVQTLHIPRWIKYTNYHQGLELHGFCDASEKAYAAVIYSRIITTQGDIVVSMLTSKTKVAPVNKQITLPRLELCAAVLLTKLLNKTKNALDIKEAVTHTWTDSKITLAWIQGEPNKWTKYVSSRVQEIRKTTDVDAWHYVKSDDNPADCASRGISPSQIKTHTLWWTGPRWLTLPKEEWPEYRRSNQDTKEEVAPKVKVNTTVIKTSDIFERFSDFNRLIRVITYCRRFVLNCRHASRQQDSPIIPAELHQTSLVLIRIVQREHFFPDIKTIQQRKPLPKNSKLLSLTPFIDKDGILRLGGRLENSTLMYSQKHPIILPHTHHLIKLIIRDAHLKTLHGGTQATLAYLRQKYWIIKAKTTIRSVIHDCVTCCRHRSKTNSQLMGNLPPTRITPSKPFTNTGLDYAGPFHIRVSKGRGTNTYKGYIAIFVCMCTKAIHLEAVSDLTTEAFLAAYKRFTARRGLCQHIYSDCGTTFKGAKGELEKQLKAAIDKSNKEATEILASQGTHWHFIPPASPHFGGLWEAGVKSTKYHLRRIAGDINFTFEEFSTVLAQIEACLNSRPLCALSNDPDDLTVLTPAHFLIGRPLVTPPEPYTPEQPISYLTRWKLINKLLNDFWKAWSSEYLSRLQNRTKWQDEMINIKIKDIVLLKDENLPPSRWALGRITEIHPGKDGLVRVVTVQTSKNVLKRPISKICKLPFNVDEFPDPNQTEKCTSIEKTNTEQPLVKSIPEDTSGIKITTTEELCSSIPPSTNISAAVATTHSIHTSSNLTETHLKRKRSGSVKIYPTSIPVRPSIDELRRSAIPSKRVKVPNLLTTVLLVNCVLSTMGATFNHHPEENLIETRPFKYNPGIYLEHIANLHLINDIWTTVVYYNLDTYYQQLDGFKECLLKLSNLCNQTVTYNYYCKSVLIELEHKVSEMQHNNLILHTRNGNHLMKKRPKRSPFDFIGSLQNSLFGVLDQNYAHYIEQEIGKLRENENYLLSLAQNQTSIAEVTTNVLKRTTEDIQKQFEIFDNHLQASLEAIRSGVKKNELVQTFNALTTYTSLIINNYERVQKELIELVLDTHHGKITPFLLSPSQLKEQIKIIREHISPTLLIPGETSQEELIKLYELVTIKSRVLDSMIVFRIQIPLPESRVFQLFKAYPIPTEHNNEYFFIEPSTEYLATSLHRDLYYPLNQSEIAQCIKTDILGFLCHQKNPVYTIQASLNKCEMEFLNHRTPPPGACRINKTKPSQYWIQLYHPNHWIFVLNEEITINIVCGNNVLIKNLKHSGIIQLKGNCKIKHPSMTITAKTKATSHQRSSFLPWTNLSTLLSSGQQNEVDNQTIPLIHLDTKPLDNLSFPKVKPTLPTLDQHHIHHYVSTYIIILIIIMISTFLVIQYIRKMRTATNSSSNSYEVQTITPTPAPRSSLHSPGPCPE